MIGHATVSIMLCCSAFAWQLACYMWPTSCWASLPVSRPLACPQQEHIASRTSRVPRSGDALLAIPRCRLAKLCRGDQYGMCCCCAFRQRVRVRMRVCVCLLLQRAATTTTLECGFPAVFFQMRTSNRKKVRAPRRWALFSPRYCRGRCIGSPSPTADRYLYTDLLLCNWHVNPSVHLCTVLRLRIPWPSAPCCTSCSGAELWHRPWQRATGSWRPIAGSHAHCVSPALCTMQSSGMTLRW